MCADSKQIWATEAKQSAQSSAGALVTQTAIWFVNIRTDLWENLQIMH